jgi:hypothetical protein
MPIRTQIRSERAHKLLSSSLHHRSNLTPQNISSSSLKREDGTYDTRSRSAQLDQRFCQELLDVSYMSHGVLDYSFGRSQFRIRCLIRHFVRISNHKVVRVGRSSEWKREEKEFEKSRQSGCPTSLVVNIDSLGEERKGTYQARKDGSCSIVGLLVRMLQSPTAMILRSFVGAFCTSGNNTGRT